MATKEIVLNVKKIQKELNILKATPWWIPVVSAIIATLIVAGVAAILHHVNLYFYFKSLNEIVAYHLPFSESQYGFFKRNRPHLTQAKRETGPESQPLHAMSQNPNRPTSEVDRTRYEDSS